MGWNVTKDDTDIAVALPVWLVEMRQKEMFAYRVQPGREAQVMRALRIRGVDAYSPTMPKDKVVSQRSRWGVGERKIKRRSIVPVFPGLLFVPSYSVDQLGARPAVVGMIDLLQFGDWIAVLNDYWCNRLIDVVLTSNTPRSKRELVNDLYEVGDAVRVVDGPMRGFPAHFDGLDSRGRLSVLISIFGRLNKVPVELDQIEPV
jgi:transcription antitermination factor NusG